MERHPHSWNCTITLIILGTIPFSSISCLFCSFRSWEYLHSRMSYHYYLFLHISSLVYQYQTKEWKELQVGRERELMGREVASQVNDIIIRNRRMTCASSKKVEKRIILNCLPYPFTSSILPQFSLSLSLTLVFALFQKNSLSNRGKERRWRCDGKLRSQSCFFHLSWILLLRRNERNTGQQEKERERD